MPGLDAAHHSLPIAIPGTPRLTGRTGRVPNVTSGIGTPYGKAGHQCQLERRPRPRYRHVPELHLTAGGATLRSADPATAAIDEQLTHEWAPLTLSD
ncbi:hypothetical protein [Streptomyces europaeiscabiei]|uniref:hypothetical protein n=1 Tax=Streptomyces europaeiscabiei TaxID=146819 RepID=UPI0038F66B41